MSLTTDPNDPRLTRGADTARTGQAEVYLVLSDEERAKGFVRPYRDTYQHVGTAGPWGALVPLDGAGFEPEQVQKYSDDGYVRFEVYPESESPKTGRLWTQAQLDAVGKGCGATTTMGRAIAETYARNPAFYGATFCVACSMHRPVAEFVWPDGSRLGS